MEMIRIEDKQFEALRESLNNMLTKTLRDMLEEGNPMATINAKIKVTLEERAVQETPTESRLAFIPTFAFKVTTVKQLKTAMEGEIYRDQMEMVLGDDGEIEYKRIAAGQMSMFDDEMEG